MKINLLIPILVLISFSLRAQPGGEEPPPCDDPDLPPEESCYYEDPDIPLDKGTPFLIAVAVFWGFQHLRKDK